MKHDGYVTKLAALIRANAVEAPPPAADAAPDLVELVIHSFMAWEATTAQADAAMGRIRSGTVSFNDFRVCLVNEVIELIGPRYPRAHERSVRVRAVLNDLFRREHKVSLERTLTMPKRDAKTYLESLQGIVPYVSSRVALLGLGIHAVPVDANLLGTLIAHGVVEQDMPLPEAAAWLLRHVSADKAYETHLALQHAVDAWVAKGSKLPSSEKPKAARRPSAAKSVAKSASARSKPRTARKAAR